MRSDHVMPEEWKRGLRNVHRSLKEIDQQRSFDRCSVGQEGCKRPSIDAHCISIASLELIADQENKVIASYAVPPRDPYSYQFSKPLAERSIRSFSVGRWSCDKHDRIFAPLDSKHIALDDKRNLFLAIYRTTLRATQLGLRTVERIAIPMLGPATQALSEVPEPYLQYMQRFATDGTLTMIRIQHLKWKVGN